MRNDGDLNEEKLKRKTRRANWTVTNKNRSREETSLQVAWVSPPCSCAPAAYARPITAIHDCLPGMKRDSLARTRRMMGWWPSRPRHPSHLHSPVPTPLYTRVIHPFVRSTVICVYCVVAAPRGAAAHHFPPPETSTNQTSREHVPIQI